MIVNATQFKNNVGRFLRLAQKEEVIITRNGKSVIKLVSIDKNETPITDSLVGAIKNTGNIDLRKEREERTKKYDNSDRY